VKHDYDRAIADLTRALAINPNNAYTVRLFRQAQQERAQALQQAQDDRSRQARVNSRPNPSSAASEAQDAQPQPAPGQAEKQQGPSYNANDEIWREQQERDARENDWNYRQLQDLNERAAEEDREADRQRQMQEDQERWNKQNGD
jgi:colicin import membrane protein